MSQTLVLSYSPKTRDLFRASWVRMITQVPVNQPVGFLSVDENVFGYSHRLVLKGLSIRGKSASASQVPSGPFGFAPYDVVNELESYSVEDGM